MFKKITIPALLFTTALLAPLSANASDADKWEYYNNHKSSYGITETVYLGDTLADVSNEDYRDGTDGLNVGIIGGSLTLTNTTNPMTMKDFSDSERTIYQVEQNGQILINDERYSGEGWSLYLKAQPLTMVLPSEYVSNVEPYVAPSGHITYRGEAHVMQVNKKGQPVSLTEPSNGTSSSGEEGLARQGLPTGLNYNAPVELDRNKLLIAYAYKGEGMGMWELSEVLNNVQINIDDTLKQDKEMYPNGTTPYVTNFEWTLISGPGNK